MKPFFVDHEGRPVADHKPTTPSQVESKEADEPLHLIAAREAARQSTKTKETR